MTSAIPHFNCGAVGSAAAGSAYSGINPYAYDYDGTNDYATRGANLTGAADGKQGTFSFWFRVDGGAGTRRTIFSTWMGTAFVQFELNTSNKFVVFGDTGGATQLSLITAGTFAADGATWHHAMVSYDLATPGARHVYIDGVSDLVQLVFNNATLDYTTGNAAVGALPTDGSLKWNGALSEIYGHMGVSAYIDLSVEANRRKFITAQGKPAFLGTNGEIPLGVQPLLYAPTGNPVTNAGSGGNFTLTGALDAASTTPFSGTITAVEVVPSFMADNGYSEDLGEYYDSSAFSRLAVSTAATSVRVGFYVDSAVYAAVGPANCEVGVWDGSTTQRIQPTGAGWNVGTLTLAPGTKTVNLVNGISVRFNPGEDTQGARLVNAAFYDAASLITPTQPATRILAYGDSIVTGASSDPITTNAWTMRLRRLYSGSVMQESWHGRALHDDGADAAARTVITDRIASYEPTIVWVAVGHNDYGLDRWTAANFQTGYADFLDKLHAALPSAAIYAQSPTVRVDESANGLGDTLGAYRTAISNACSGRPWVTFVDGSTFITTSDLIGDGIHPTSAGHGKIYLAVADELGMSPGSLQFSATNYNVNDNAGNVTVSVTRTSGSVGTVTVNYATSNGTATQPADYTATSGTLTWTNGDTANKTFSVSVVNDLDVGSETINLTLSAPTGNAVIGAQGTATITIVPSV